MINWRMRYDETADQAEDSVYMFPATESGIIKIGADEHYWRHLEENNTEKLVSIPTQDYKLLPAKSLRTYKKFVSGWLPDLSSLGIDIGISRY